MTNPLEDFDVIYQGRIEPQQRCVSAVATFGCGVTKVLLQRLLGIEEYSPEHLPLAAAEMRATVLTSVGLPTSDQNQDETRGQLP